MRVLRGLLCAALISVIAVAAVAAEPAAADTGSDEMAFVARLNELRASKGLPALATKGSLFDMARSWSGRMQQASGISHNPSLAAVGPAGWTRLGENVGMGYDVQGLFEAFVASPLHYRNMVDPQFDAVGVGVVHRGDGMIYVTVNFMTTKASPAAAAAVAGDAAARKCVKTRKGKVVCRVARARRR